MTKPLALNAIAQVLRLLYGANRVDNLYRVNRMVPKWAVGQTWGDFIFVRQEVFGWTKEGFDRLVRHENTHIKQSYRLGYWGFGFIVVYLWYSIKYGYKGNPLEIEADQNENG